MTDALLDLIAQVFEEKKAGGVQTEPPVSPQTLRDFAAHLAENGLPPLPEEWTAFLKQADGLRWNGVILCGIDEDGEEDEDEPFTHGGLLEFNRRPRPADKPASRFLLLGQTDTDYLAYDLQEKCYLSLDATDWQISAVYPDFDAFFKAQAEIMLGEAPLA